MRSALVPSLCVEVPQLHGSTARLRPCNSSSDGQKFKTWWPELNSHDDGTVGWYVNIATYTPPNLFLCDNGTKYIWVDLPSANDTHCGWWNTPRLVTMTPDRKLKSYDSYRYGPGSGCFVADILTSSALYGSCDASPLAASWFLESPGMASAPPPVPVSVQLPGLNPQ